VAESDWYGRRRYGSAQAAQLHLTEEEEAIVVEFRRRTMLPLDDVSGCLRGTIPTLSRSALHLRLVRHGILRLPQDEQRSSKRKRFAETVIGYADHPWTNGQAERMNRMV
jgi:hypothetical protein